MRSPHLGLILEETVNVIKTQKGHTLEKIFRLSIC